MLLQHRGAGVHEAGGAEGQALQQHDREALVGARAHDGHRSRHRGRLLLLGEEPEVAHALLPGLGHREPADEDELGRALLLAAVALVVGQHRGAALAGVDASRVEGVGPGEPVAGAEAGDVPGRGRIDAHAGDGGRAVSRPEARAHQLLLGRGEEREGPGPREDLPVDGERERRLVVGRGHEHGPLRRRPQPPVRRVVEVGEEHDRGEAVLLRPERLDEGGRVTAPAGAGTRSPPRASGRARRAARRRR